MEINKIKYLLMPLALNNNFSMPRRTGSNNSLASHNSNEARVPSSHTTSIEVNQQSQMSLNQQSQMSLNQQSQMSQEAIEQLSIIEAQRQQLLLLKTTTNDILKDLQPYMSDLINLKDIIEVIDQCITIKKENRTYIIRKDTAYTLEIRIEEATNTEETNGINSINGVNALTGEPKLDNLKKDRITHFIQNLEYYILAIRSNGKMDDNNHPIFLTNDIPGKEICLTLVNDSVYIFQMQSKKNIDKNHLIVLKPGTGLIADNKIYANIKEIITVVFMFFVTLFLTFSTITKNMFDITKK